MFVTTSVRSAWDSFQDSARPFCGLFFATFPFLPYQATDA